MKEVCLSTKLCVALCRREGRKEKTLSAGLLAAWEPPSSSAPSSSSSGFWLSAGRCERDEPFLVVVIFTIKYYFSVFPIKDIEIGYILYSHNYACDHIVCV